MLINALNTVSIGPRPFRHGNKTLPVIGGSRPLSFNWATSFQTWKYGSGPTASTITHLSFNWATSFQTWKCIKMYGIENKWWGFNWATSFQTWKYRNYIANRILLATFQLGHVLSDMEMLSAEVKSNRPYRFNWATSFQTWKFVSYVGFFQ